MSGKIAASENITLRFQTSGRLAWVGVKEGDFVKKYQTIATLDKRELQKTLEKYLNTYMTSRWTYETTKDSSGDQSAMSLSVKRALEKSGFDLGSAVLDVELKNLALEYAALWTPIDGLVAKADSPLAGVNVTPTQAEFQIINPNSLYFSATADQNDVINLTASQAGVITLDAFPDSPIKSQIQSISFTPKEGETGTVYEIKMNLPPSFWLAQNLPRPESLRLGMTGDAEFIIKNYPSILAIPSKFLKSEGQTKYVWLANKNKQTVKTGLTIDNNIEIKDGLKEGDTIFEN